MSSTRRKTHEKHTVFWESSRRPLYPKWVWTDAVGQRHFILDHPIGDAGPIQSSAARSLLARSRQVRKSSSYDGTMYSDDHIVGDNRRRGGERGDTRVAGARRLSNLSDCVLESSAIPNTTEEDDQEDTNKHTESTPSAAAVGNPLTERVLQWLDLAGRTTLIRPENGDDTDKSPHGKTLTRRICTAQLARNRRKSTQIRRFSAGVQYLAPLAEPRTESMHQLSLTFEANGVPPDSDDVAATPDPLTSSAEAAEVAAAAAAAETASAAPRYTFGEFVPTAYRCARIFAAKRHAAAAATLPPLQQQQQQQHDASAVGAATHEMSRNQKTANGATKVATPTAAGRHRSKVSKGGQQKQQQHNQSSKVTLPTAAQIEQQYHSLIQRKLLENNCNESAARRQLHIFMPNLPDKKTTTTADGNGGAAAGADGRGIGDVETSSGLSTILSATVL